MTIRVQASLFANILAWIIAGAFLFLFVVAIFEWPTAPLMTTRVNRAINGHIANPKTNDTTSVK